MKLIFLHGLGQKPAVWNDVREILSDYPSEALDVSGSSYSKIRARVLQSLQEESQDFVLVGLSLGGMLALDLAREYLPHLRALVLSGTQYKLTGNVLFRLQIAIMKCLPDFIYGLFSAQKSELVPMQEELARFDVEKDLPHLFIPTLVICGTRDFPNRRSSRDLVEKLPQASIDWIDKGGHVLNVERPEALAQAIQDFLQKEELEKRFKL